MNIEQDMARPERTYIVHSRAWYAESAKLERDVCEAIHIQYAEGSRSWEFSILLYKLSPSRSAFRVEMFDDTWSAFTDVPELFRALADRGEDADVGEIEATLTELGFEDVTRTENPEDSPPVPMHNCSRCGKIEPVQ